MATEFLREGRPAPGKMAAMGAGAGPVGDFGSGLAVGAIDALDALTSPQKIFSAIGDTYTHGGGGAAGFFDVLNMFNPIVQGFIAIDRGIDAANRGDYIGVGRETFNLGLSVTGTVGAVKGAVKVAKKVGSLVAEGIATEAGGASARATATGGAEAGATTGAGEAGSAAGAGEAGSTVKGPALAAAAVDAAPAESNAAAVIRRVAELRDAIPEAQRGRITMGVGVAVDEAGVTRTLISTSEPAGYLRPGVTLKPGEILVKGTGHAEVDIANYAKAKGWQLLEVGATRPICPPCADTISAAGANPTTPLKKRRN